MNINDDDADYDDDGDNYYEDDDDKVSKGFFPARGKFATEEQNGEHLTLLLAEDRTEVDDEEYFQTLGEGDDNMKICGKKAPIFMCVKLFADDNTLFVLVPRREGRSR